MSCSVTADQWEPINSQIIRFLTRCFKLTIFQGYAPTNDHEEADNDRVYNTLNIRLADVPKHDLLAVMRDMKFKIGDNNEVNIV